MKEKYIPGGGCLCHAHSEAECGCDVDWTPREVYELREQRDRLAEALQIVLTSWDDATWLDDNQFESFRETLQSLTNPNEL
jgi:hypothetical protein